MGNAVRIDSAAELGCWYRSANLPAVRIADPQRAGKGLSSRTGGRLRLPALNPDQAFSGSRRTVTPLRTASEITASQPRITVFPDRIAVIPDRITVIPNRITVIPG